MVRIGTHVLRNPHLLAPMAGASEMPFRCLALRLGAALAPTELLSAAGLARGSARTLRYLRHDSTLERPFCVQLFGGDPEEVAEAAARAAEHGAEIIDLNMGCPVPKVTKNGAGSALLCDPTRAARIVAAVARRTGLPVTAKIRSGWDQRSVNAVEVARALEDAGAAGITLHPRTRAQGYSGRADWSLIARVREAVSTTLIGNGDVRTPADAVRMLRETGCDAVMVGRAALGNPWIFRELLGGAPPTPEERRATIRAHFDAHVELAGGGPFAVRSFRRMLLWYSHALRGAAAFRKTVLGLDDPEEVRACLDRFFASAPREAQPAGDLEIDYRTAFG
jgi:nifR3 family TIM-barrel protein